MKIVVYRENAFNWYWGIDDYGGERPWWGRVLQDGYALTEKRAWRKAERAARDRTLREETRNEREVA